MTTYVKIMSDENEADDNGSKGFTLVPIPDKGYFKFERVYKINTVEYSDDFDLSHYKPYVHGEERDPRVFDTNEKTYPVLLIWESLDTVMPKAIELTGNAYVIDGRTTVATYSFSKHRK